LALAQASRGALAPRWRPMEAAKYRPPLPCDFCAPYFFISVFSADMCIAFAMLSPLRCASVIAQHLDAARNKYLISKKTFTAHRLAAIAVERLRCRSSIRF
jgi:hypothetical protein